MKKKGEEIDLFKVYPANKNKFKNTENIRTTDINILLNRVRLTKKNEFKKKIIFTFLILLIACSGVFFLI